MDPSARITELEAELDQAHAKLTESYQMASVGRLMAGVIHEINTPIGSIVSNNEVLTRSLEMVRTKLQESIASGSAPPPRVLEILNTLISLASVDKMACERILSVIRGLKTCARVEEGELRSVDVADLVQGALRLAQSQYKRRVAMETSFADLPEVECYPHLLSQVFLNLIVNGAQAIEGEGRIKVTTRRAGEMAEIEITDTGRGMSSEQKTKVFQRGFTTKAPGEGTGLGLSISHDIVVEKHKGSIEFESELGKGTTFRIRVPFSQTTK